MSQPPQSETASQVPASQVPEPTPTFGWSAYAERLNGRFAMIGFVALLAIELFTGQGFLAWIGLR